MGRSLWPGPAALSALVAVVIAAAGCGGASGKPAATSTADYPLPPRKVRLFEKPLNGHTVTDGHLAFTPIGYRPKMPYVIGSHAELDPQGLYTRVRVVLENIDRTDHPYSAAGQQLITTDGKSYKPDYEAMEVERQPEATQVGSGVRIEFDLLWDIPKDATPQAVRFQGDVPGSHGVDFPLPH